MQSTWRGYGGGPTPRAPTSPPGPSRSPSRSGARLAGPRRLAGVLQRAGLTRANGGATSTPVSTRVDRAQAGDDEEGRQEEDVRRHVRRKKEHCQGRQDHRPSGDTLGKIAARYHVAGGWKALWKANGARVTNPNLIFVGQTLRLP